MIAEKLPSVLYVPCSTPGYSNSISVERALKLVLRVLESPDECTDDEYNAAVSDVKAMLSKGFE